MTINEGGRANLPMEIFSKWNAPFYDKIHTPPFCCLLLLEFWRGSRSLAQHYFICIY